MKPFKHVLILLVLMIFNSCSTNEDENEQSGDTSLLIGKWHRISTEDQDGNVSDDTSTCDLTEFTDNSYIVTEYSDSNCTQEFSSGSLPYTRVDDFIYFGEISRDIKVEITDLSSTTLKLKGEYTDNDGMTYYDIVTYNRR